MMMLEYLDIRTLSYTNVVFSFIYGIGLIVYAANHRSFVGITRIGIGFIYLGSGFMMLGMRQYVHDFISIVMANMFIFVAFGFITEGLLRFRSASIIIPRLWYPVALIFLFVSFAYFTFSEPNVNARILIIVSLIGGQSLFISYVLLFRSEQVGGIANSFLGAIYFSFALLNIIRFFITLGEDSIENFMQASLIHSITILAYQVLVLFTCFAVLWIASSLLEKELVEQARTDPLTKVYNRRALEDIAHIELSRTRRSRRSLSIIICDIDHFKLFNDNHGHQMGDTVLKEFASILKRNLREHDVVARYGGEEFLVLLPETDLESAGVIAEKLRLKVADHQIYLNKKKPLTISASFGVACYEKDIVDWQQMIKAADHALYEAKNEGRNRVICFSERDCF